MAVVPDRRIAITHKLKMLKTNQAIVVAALEKLIKTNNKIETQHLNDNNHLIKNEINKTGEINLLNNASEEIGNNLNNNGDCGSSNTESKCKNGNHADMNELKIEVKSELETNNADHKVVKNFYFFKSSLIK